MFASFFGRAAIPLAGKISTFARQIVRDFVRRVSNSYPPSKHVWPAPDAAPIQPIAWSEFFPISIPTRSPWPSLSQTRQVIAFCTILSLRTFARLHRDYARWTEHRCHIGDG